MINSFMQAARTFAGTSAGVRARMHHRCNSPGPGCERCSKPWQHASNWEGRPGTNSRTAGRRVSEPRQLGMQRDLPRWRRHSRRRNHLAMAEWPQLAAFSNDRGRTDLRVRHPAAH